MKNYFFISILSFLIFSSNVFASTSASFILDKIWYSQDSFVEGETVKIYTAVWNGNNSSLSAKVEFYDKNVILGTRDIVVPREELQEVSVSWKVTSGDHTISAKILSSSISVDGKKEIITINSNTTKIDRQFVPVTIEKENGDSIPSNEIIKDELDKVGDKINEIVPTSISTPVSNSLAFVDEFRDNSLIKILDSKEKAREKILSFKDSSEQGEVVQLPKTLEEATEKPIAQVKLFFLKILEFIFSHKLVFYGLIILLIFYFLRGFYRKIRNR